MLIIRPDTKKCMSELLLKETFDHLLFIEGEITTANKFHIDGYLQKAFFTPEERETALHESYSDWKSIREFCFSIIKGTRTPLNFKLILSLPGHSIAELLAAEETMLSPADVQGLYLNFSYDGEALQCITGVSLSTFIPDKSLEHIWDRHAQKLFTTCEIPFDIVE